MSGIWDAYKQGTRAGAKQRGRYGTTPIRAGYSDIKKVTKDVAYLKGLINVEFKYEDTVVDQQMTSAANIALLNGVAAGTGEQQRIGKTIRIKSVEVQALVRGDNSANNTMLRTLLVWDRQPSGSLPAIGEIIENTTYPWVSPRNLDNRHRFMILRDIHKAMGDDGPNTAKVKFYMKMNRHTVYQASGGTITAINSGALYLIYISNHTTVAPNVQSFARVRYIDN